MDNEQPEWPGWPFKDAPIMVNSITAALLAWVSAEGFVVLMAYIADHRKH